MISIEDRQRAVELIAVACNEGATLTAACEVVGISIRTHQRWMQAGKLTGDKRPVAERPAPANPPLSGLMSRPLLHSLKHSGAFGDLYASLFR